MDRWKISEINSLDDVQFARVILFERRAKLTPYSPLAVKIGNACHTLNQIDLGKLTPKELVRLNEEGRMGCPTCLSPDYLRNGCLYNRYCGNCGQALKREEEK